MNLIRTLLLLLVAALLGAGAFIWFGVYNVAADDPHWSITYRAMETLRQRSIGTRSAAIQVPPLDDPALIRSGAGNYNSMCVGCHLRPDAADTELSLGLYPQPPAWSALGTVEPREAFWVIKHGIKMSGMPAWGRSMDDRYIWGMVAFMRQFPGMTAAQYQAHVAASPGHSHGGGETEVHGPGHADEPAAEALPRSSFEPIDDPMAPDPDSHAHGAEDDHAH
jgi:mono/diheme cytochrome c family protein